MTTTFRATRGQLQTYAAATLKAIAVNSTWLVDDTAVWADLSGLTLGTAVTLTGVDWDDTRDLPALIADDFTITAITGTAGSWVVYDNATHDLIAADDFAPLTLTAESLPVVLVAGALADVSDDGSDIDSLDTRLALIEGGGTVSQVWTSDGTDDGAGWADATGGGGGSVLPMLPLFVYVDLDFGDPAGQMIPLIEGAYAWFFTDHAIGDTPWEFAGIYAGHSPDSDTPAALTLASRQPVVGDQFFSRGMVNLSTSDPDPRAAPLGTDQQTFRVGYVSANNGIDSPVFGLLMEKPQGSPPHDGTTADFLTYLPADAAATWAGLSDGDAIDAAEALDRLAAAVAGLLGTTIP